MLTIIRITNEAITMKPFSFVISKVARVRSEVFTRGEITPTARAEHRLAAYELGEEADLLVLINCSVYIRM